MADGPTVVNTGGGGGGGTAVAIVLAIVVIVGLLFFTGIINVGGGGGKSTDVNVRSTRPRSKRQRSRRQRPARHPRRPRRHRLLRHLAQRPPRRAAVDLANANRQPKRAMVAAPSARAILGGAGRPRSGSASAMASSRSRCHRHDSEWMFSHRHPWADGQAADAIAPGDNPSVRRPGCRPDRHSCHSTGETPASHDARRRPAKSLSRLDQASVSSLVVVDYPAQLPCPATFHRARRAARSTRL